jgi:glucosamine-6-phosphate deaminase
MDPRGRRASRGTGGPPIDSSHEGDTDPLVEVLPAARWADHVAGLLADRLAARPDLVVCLPTGATPLPAYDRLPAALDARGASAARATIVVLDDYLGLPPGHPGRSREVLRRAVVERLSPSPVRFIAFDVDDASPADACRRFDAEVADAGGLDLVVLGLGRNGHVGVNEPGSPAEAPTRVVQLAGPSREAARRYGVDPPPTQGVTLGIAAFLAAPELWLLVSGEEKAGILARALEGPITEDVPASLLRRSAALRVIADEPAAAALRRAGVVPP